ncbi:hypothetical protein TYRP_013658 [Tyrophagus putrescentiae]|nr:hypothetical protein TYRP_013658 [Tyrophagus putrescentiae]
MNTLEYAGVASLLYLFVNKPLKLLVSWLANNKLYQNVAERVLNPGPEDYAVITGATDGIGLEYARQLADKGYNLVLLSRTEEKLHNVVGKISKQYPQDIYRLIKERLSAISGRMYLSTMLALLAAYPIDFPICLKITYRQLLT